MECRDAQFYLRLRRHTGDELGPDVTVPLDNHLAVCATCAADNRAASSFDRALCSAMKAVSVPAGLRERLFAHVAGKQGTIRRHKMYRAAGALVAALLLVGIGLGWFSNTRPKPDAFELVENLDEQWRDPELSTGRWLAKHKLPNTLPQPLNYNRPFNYRLHVNHAFEEIKGRQVPVVVFRSPDGDIAKVYIFRNDGTFDLKALREEQLSNAHAEKMDGEGEHRGFTYVFVYTGRDLTPFLARTNTGGSATT